MDVLSHVTSDGFNVGGSAGGGIVIDDLVTGEEGQGVVVLGERIDGSEDVLEIEGVVRWCGGSTVERVLGGVDIEDQVDACRCQRVHACIMVGGVVDGVDSHGVNAELLEVANITLAAGFIGNGVDDLGGSSGLVVNTTDVETVVSGEECCMEVSTSDLP